MLINCTRSMENALSKERASEQKGKVVIANVAQVKDINAQHLLDEAVECVLISDNPSG